jgi:hypothetical protein
MGASINCSEFGRAVTSWTWTFGRKRGDQVRVQIVKIDVKYCRCMQVGVSEVSLLCQFGSGVFKKL